MLPGGFSQLEAKNSKFLEVREIGINFHADFLVKTLLDVALAFHMNIKSLFRVVEHLYTTQCQVQIKFSL